MMTTMNNTLVAYSYEALMKIKEELNKDDSVRSYRVLRNNEYASETFVVEINK